MEVSQQEKDNPPALAKALDNIDEYDTIFLGYPIWWGGLPPIAEVFLQSSDFSGKTIIPFSTHGGSGLGNSRESIIEAAPDAEVMDGFSIRGSDAQNDPEKIDKMITDWLSENGY